MQFITSAQGYRATANTTCDISTTLDVQIGDVLIAYIAGDISGSANFSSLIGTDGYNSFTTLAFTSWWWRMAGAYLISAVARTGVTFRATLSEISNGNWGLVVLQFRPDSGELVSFGSAPAAAGGLNSNPTSGQLSTTSIKNIFIGGATTYTEAISNQQIDSTAVDGYVSHSNINFVVGYKSFNSAKTNIVYSTIANSSSFGIEMIGLDIGESFIKLAGKSLYEGMSCF